MQKEIDRNIIPLDVKIDLLVKCKHQSFASVHVSEPEKSKESNEFAKELKHQEKYRNSSRIVSTKFSILNPIY